jgi:hypothetical protein
METEKVISSEEKVLEVEDIDTKEEEDVNVKHEAS